MKFVIHGSAPLSGRHTAPGNKNAALPMIAASIMAKSPVTLSRLPLIRDVRVMLEILHDLGAGVALDEKNHAVTIDPTTITPKPLDEGLCRQVRASILFAGPLAARFGEAAIPSPGGDAIGRRRLDTHFDGLRALGFDVTETAPLTFRRAAGHKACATRIVFDEASVTATENVVMAAALSNGTTTLYNAACEPHVQDLCRMINLMGGNVTGIGTNQIVIHGVTQLAGCSVAIGPDAIEAASFIAAAAATHGSLTLDGIHGDEFDIIERPFKRLGVRWERHDDGSLFLPAAQELRIVNDAEGAIPTIADGIWPAIPSDILSALIVLSCCSDGVVLFFEKMFESRMYFVDHLINMGARIVPCDPHRLVVHGRTRLHGTVVTSPDIRAGMALLIAGLAASGTTTIHNAESIDRGYESIETALQSMGAAITRE
ncbi:MAG: UDP-N-acetylglucosamine 1-carboxyvinyltransferase [Kiritimatiellaeota bacterium]|nr:UDP-N-acetylglucosamine 1-carboxyvinyltransferase [Kiritimatiellota bacterium]